jgi:CO/xanthine dehydrogenase Mo-binding subunit
MIDLVEEIEPAGPYGAKSIGECSVVPAAAAIANAVSNAIGVTATTCRSRRNGFWRSYDSILS